MGTTESGDVYLNLLDTTERLNVRLYAFANSRERAYVIDAHIVPRSMTEAECKGDTHKDLDSGTVHAEMSRGLWSTVRYVALKVYSNVADMVHFRCLI